MRVYLHVSLQTQTQTQHKHKQKHKHDTTHYLGAEPESLLVDKCDGGRSQAVASSLRKEKAHVMHCAMPVGVHLQQQGKAKKKKTVSAGTMLNQA